MNSRHSQILEILQNQESATVQQLSEICSVSTNTIRIDLDNLANKELLSRTHGGAKALKKNKVVATELITRSQRNSKAKKIIAQLVLNQLPKKEHFSLFFDSSTSGLEVGKLLAELPYRFTVITHFNNIAMILGQTLRCSIVLCGGRWWHDEQCTLGQDVITALKLYKADIALIGCTGIHQETGLTNGNIETVEIKKMMVEQAVSTWLLCDHSKFDNQDLMYMCSWEDISKIFTDKEPSQEWKTFFQENNIELHYSK